MNAFFPYFLQSRSWAEFWLSANSAKHETHQIKCQIDINNQPVEIVAYIYQYPWYFGQKFLYIPKGPFLQMKTDIQLNKNQVDELLTSFLKETLYLAKTLKASFVKIDFDDNLTNLLDISNNLALQTYLQTNYKYKFVFNTKSLQYLQTPVLDCSSLQKINLSNTAYSYTQVYLQDFFEQNALFWSTVNQNTRRNTRKSLTENWQISTDKTLPNFESFWQLIKDTSSRQHFSTHPQSYYRELFDQDFSRIIILRDQQGRAHTVWFGINLNRTLTYLYGGNSTDSRNTHSQYLVHLTALAMASQENCQFYDLGGYDENKGYGQFKLGYRGQIRSFLGPVDMVVNPINYLTISNLVNFGKNIFNYFTSFFKRDWKFADFVFKFIIGLLITTCLPFWVFTLMSHISNLHTATEKVEVAIVFGASVDFVNVIPSPVLRMRLDKSLELYKSGKIKTILVSGDNREEDYNEPFVMKKYLVDNGVSAVNVVEDFGGRRTLDTCWRAKNVFKAEKVYLITQSFHLPRADFNCRQVGLETILIPANDSHFNTTFWGVIREIPASWLAVQEFLRGYEPPVKSDGTEIKV